MKTCLGCGDTLPAGCFNADCSKPDGRYPRCKVCRSGTAAVVKVGRWRTCRCGKLFRPRTTTSACGRTVHCSRVCQGRARSGAEHHNWRGEDATYSAIHARLKHTRRKPAGCEECGEERKLHWALMRDRCTILLSSSMGPYSTDLSAYDALCVPCHKRMDLGLPDLEGVI